MQRTLPSAGISASKAPPGNGSDPLASESAANEWFYEAARDLLGKDSGYVLHILTGYPESSCYAYVAKNPQHRRRPREHFLRKLFATPQGRAFHAAFMAASGAPWWRDYERAQRITAQIDNLDLE